MKKEIEGLLEEIFVGNFYSYVGLGDTWEFLFDRFYLIAQEITAPEEEKLNKLLLDNAPSFLDTVDKEDVAKLTIAKRNSRKEIKKISIKNDSSLVLTFDKERELCFTTSTDIVDWQWCINESGKTPYEDLIVACLFSGEIEINNKKVENVFSL